MFHIVEIASRFIKLLDTDLCMLLASFESRAANLPEKPAATETGQKTFASPEDGGKALVAAAKAGDRDALLAIFGQQSKDIIFSGDAAQDKFVRTVHSRLRNHEPLAQADRRKRSALPGSRQQSFPHPAEEEWRGAVVFRCRGWKRRDPFTPHWR